MRLIGLCGAAGAGKDTVAVHLAAIYGFRVISFAAPLYEAVSAITGMTVGELRDRRLKEKKIGWIGKSPRELLQILGTEFGRNMIRDDIWIRRAMVDVERSSTPCVITDVRFDNEAEAIRQADGVIFEVVRPGFTLLSGTTAQHPSERGVSREHILATITNSGEIPALIAAVDAAFSTLHADIMQGGPRYAFRTPKEGRNERTPPPDDC